MGSGPRWVRKGGSGRACRAFKVEEATARESVPGALSYVLEKRAIARERVSAGLSASLSAGVGTHSRVTSGARARMPRRPFHGLHIISRIFLARDNFSVICDMPYTQVTLFHEVLLSGEGDCKSRV